MQLAVRIYTLSMLQTEVDLFLRCWMIFVGLIALATAKAEAVSYCKFLLDPPSGFEKSGSGLLTELVEASHDFAVSGFGELGDRAARDLLQLVREADRAHLESDLADSERQLFQKSIDSAERVIIQQLRLQNKTGDTKISHDTLQLLASAVRLLAPRVADDVRVEVGKILIDQLKKSPDLGLDILDVLKTWRYRPNAAETVQVVQFIFQVWNHEKLPLESKVRAFTALPRMLGQIPEALLKPFINLAMQWAHNPASAFKHHASSVMWSFVQLNPNSALGFVNQLSAIPNFHLPMPQGHDRQIGHAGQVRFVYLYLLKVLKTNIPWLEREAKKFASIEQQATHPTELQFRLLRALQVNGVQAVLEYHIPHTMIVVDLFVTHPGAKGRIIELDGSHHFLTLEDFSKSSLLPDIRRDELLREMGYLVHRLTNREAMEEVDRLVPPWARDKNTRDKAKGSF